MALSWSVRSVAENTCPERGFRPPSGVDGPKLSGTSEEPVGHYLRAMRDPFMGAGACGRNLATHSNARVFGPLPTVLGHLSTGVYSKDWRPGNRVLSGRGRQPDSDPIQLASPLSLSQFLPIPLYTL